MRAKPSYKWLWDEGRYPIFLNHSASATERLAMVAGRELLNFSSNNYLGLACDTAVVSAAQEALFEHGLGPCGSRHGNASLELHDQLERALAGFLGYEAVVLFPTGYAANAAVFRSLLTPLERDKGLPCAAKDAAIFMDQHCHGSLSDGAAASGIETQAFRHLNGKETLERMLKKSKAKYRWIVTQGAFPNEGTLADLNALANTASEYEATLFVDDAHGIGVIGEGRGTVTHLNAPKPDLLMGSLDKAFGAIGGFVAGAREEIDYLRAVARPNMFSSALPAVMCAGVITGLKVVESDDGQERIRKLRELSAAGRSQLREKGFEILGDDEHPVLSLFIGRETDAIAFGSCLVDGGVLAIPFIWPAATERQARIRITPTSLHEPADITALVAACVKARSSIPGLIEVR